MPIRNLRSAPSPGVIYRLGFLWLMPFGYLWFTLINQLRPEWTTNPQYSYGWVVPLLCLGLAGQRWQASVAQALNSAGQASRLRGVIPELHPTGPVVWLVALGALGYLPARMLQAADATWRLVDWLLAFDVVGLSLCGLYCLGGTPRLRRYAFPICFFLVAVPWIYPLEKWLVERLTFGASAATVEVLGWLGLPAVAHGKVIEVQTGMVGLDEACSGIRSFQSSLMISLFLGAFYELARYRRFLLIPIGFLLSFIFNVCRTSLLTWIAARKGVAAIADYHDQAGVTILLACTASMWLLALMMRKPEVLRDPRAPGTVRAPRPQLSELGIPAASTFGRFVIPLGSLLIWFTLVEVTVVVWSHSGAAAAQTAARWSIAWPTENPTFKQQKPDKAALRLLQYDEAQQAEWSEANGTHWQAYYFDWHPGRVGAYLAANRHSPEVCMTYAGWEMRAGPESSVVEVSGLHLPFRRYTFAQEGNVLHVFHCRWEPAFETDPALLQAHPPGTTLRGLRGLSVLWSAKGKGGQKILEFIIQGCESADAAQAALQHRLQKLVAIGPQRGPDL